MATLIQARRAIFYFPHLKSCFFNILLLNCKVIIEGQRICNQRSRCSTSVVVNRPLIHARFMLASASCWNRLCTK